MARNRPGFATASIRRLLPSQSLRRRERESDHVPADGTRGHHIAGADRGRRGRNGERQGGGHDGEGDLRRRLLLVHGGAVRYPSRGGLGHRRVRRRDRGESDLRAGVRGEDRPRRNGPDRVRSLPDRIREAARDLLAQHRPDGYGPPGLRCRFPVPNGHLLPQRRAAPVGREIEGGAREDQVLPGADRHGNHGRGAVLPGRGVSPALLQEEPDPLHLLPYFMRPRQPAQAVVGKSGRSLIRTAGSIPGAGMRAEGSAMFPSKKSYGGLSFVLLLSLWVLTAPGSTGGPAPRAKEYPAATFYVARYH